VSFPEYRGSAGTGAGSGTAASAPSHWLPAGLGSWPLADIVTSPALGRPSNHHNTRGTGSTVQHHVRDVAEEQA